MRVVLGSVGLAAVALGGWYLWWRLGSLDGTGTLGTVFLVVETLSWMQFASVAALPFLARWREGPPGAPSGTLDVFVTVCGEPVEMVEQTLVAALRIGYPHRTYVLNDGRIAGKQNWREIEQLALRLGVQCFTRTRGLSGKAGNLNYALALTDGEFVATIDADHLAAPEFAHETLGYLADDRVGFVCTYQRFRTVKRDVLNNREPFFYTVIQPAKDAAGCAISCGNGTVYRRSALADLGGFSDWNFVEDLHTSYRLHAAGWTSVFHPRPVTTGTAPETAAEYMMQRQRWAMDSLHLLIRDCPLIRPRLRWSHRFHYLQTTSFYLISWFQLVFVGAALGYAYTRHSVVNSPSAQSYLLHALPYLLSVFAFLAIGQRGLVSAVRGLQVLLFTAPMFAAAAIRVVIGGSPPGQATPKRRERRLSGQLIAPAILLGALILGLASVLRDGRPGVSPIGLFWVTFSAFLLAGPIATVTRRPHGSAGLRTGLRAAIAGVAVLALPATVTVAPLAPGASRVEAASADSMVVPEKRPSRPVPMPAAQRLIPPASGAYFGTTIAGPLASPSDVAQWSPQGKVSIIQWFQQWRSGEKRVRRDWLDTVHRSGAVPMIVWEPWARPPGGYASPDQAGASVTDIASGRYDAYIRAWARALAAYRRPVLIKFMHEMNGWWYPWSVGVNGNTPAGYVRAWRHVHGLFRAAGATNVSWVWSLNTGLGFEREAFPPASYYPGHQYVDWVGVSGMNWGTTQSWSTWLSADTIFSGDYRRLRAFGRPIMISEIGSVDEGGSQAVWVTETLDRFRRKYPAVRAVVWFDAWYNVGVDFRLGDRSRRALVKALAHPYWSRPVARAPTAHQAPPPVLRRPPPGVR